VTGLPLKLNGTQWETVQATGEATATGLFLDDNGVPPSEALANNAITARKYQILVRGPALYNKSVIPAKDLAGAAYTLATLVTQLATLQMQPMVEPTKQATQTT